MVRKAGLEPARREALEPKSSASTSSATFATDADNAIAPIRIATHFLFSEPLKFTPEISLLSALDWPCSDQSETSLARSHAPPRRLCANRLRANSINTGRYKGSSAMRRT